MTEAAQTGRIGKSGLKISHKIPIRPMLTLRNANFAVTSGNNYRSGGGVRELVKLGKKWLRSATRTVPPSEELVTLSSIRLKGQFSPPA